MLILFVTETMEDQTFLSLAYGFTNSKKKWNVKKYNKWKSVLFCRPEIGKMF